MPTPLTSEFQLLRFEKKIWPADPFATLDQEGVGQLVDIGVRKGRETRADLKVGICGEHGGDYESVKFCHRVGMNYVSCSPFRVPIARLAAAHAALEEKKSKKKPDEADAKECDSKPPADDDEDDEDEEDEDPLAPEEGAEGHCSARSFLI